MKIAHIIILRTILTTFAIMATFSFAFSRTDDYDSKSLTELMETGRNHYRNNEVDSALLIFSVVADKYDDRMPSADKELCIHALNNVGIIDAFYHLDYVSAYNNLASSLDLAVDNGLKHSEAIVCLNIAELFINYYQHFKTDAAAEKIKEYSLRGFRKAYEAQHYECMGGIVVNLLTADLNTPTDDYTELFNEDVPSDRRNISYARSLVKIADLYKSGKFEETRQALNDASQLINSEWNPERYAVSLSVNIANTYIAEQDFVLAEQWLQKALSQAESLGNIDQQINILSTLSAMSTPSSEIYKLQYFEIINSVMFTGRLQMISELDFLRSLNNERKKSAKLSESRLKLLICLGIGGMLLIIASVFSVIVARLNRKLSERNRTLYMHIRTQAASEDSKVKQEAPTSTDKYSGLSLNNERIDEIYSKVMEVLSDTETVCSQGFTLSKLAATIDVNSTYVSRVINEKYGCSFSSLVSKLRIKIACARMDDHAHYGNLTIEAISHSVGFVSRNTFVNAFKKVNGMTPSEYLKASQEFASGEKQDY